MNSIKANRQTVSLNSQVEEVMLFSGCDMVGVANVSRFKGAPVGRRPTDILPTARSVIVGAVHILDSVCDDLPETRYEYTNQYYVLNGTLGLASTKEARLLKDMGYRAIPIPAAYPRIKGTHGRLLAPTCRGFSRTGRDWTQQSPDHPPIRCPCPIGFHHHRGPP